jgi:alkylhydroperoxidase family enzyme
MTTGAHQVDYALWESLRAHFDEGQIVELAAVIGLLNYTNRFNDALRVDLTYRPER